MSDLEPFGDGTAWLAVLDRTQADVAEALGLTGGRVVEPREVAAASSQTGILPPVPGVGGRWTLAVSHRLAGISATRLGAISAMLGTQVLVYDTLSSAVAHDVLDLASAESIDPRSLSGQVRGNPLLFDDVDEGPPRPELTPTPSRTPWLWSKLTRR